METVVEMHTKRCSCGCGFFNLVYEPDNDDLFILCAECDREKTRIKKWEMSDHD